MPDEELVAILRLLFSGYDRSTIVTAVNEVMAYPENKRTRRICEHCGGDNISFDATVVWDTKLQQLDLGCSDIERCWCADCEGETHDLEVAHDYVHPNKSSDETHG
jgi:hypothetical protein